MSNPQLTFWSSYWGLLAHEEISGHKFEILGFENISTSHKSKSSFVFQGQGTLWGFTQEGTLKAKTGDVSWEVKPLQWFCLPFKKGAELFLAPGTRVFIMHADRLQGLSSMGGPVEAEGRLRYIDGCTDSVLYSPPMIGDPCMNLLHFPEGVDQTEHYHPSFRSGIVCRGTGVCVSASDDALEVGTIFYLPSKMRHKFRTTQHSMDVISFHPDSDWGPTHDIHPMINRTWGTNGTDGN
ncbi:MAG: cupin domain-containing protein [Bdellovibrionota bacterium]